MNQCNHQFVILPNDKTFTGDVRNLVVCVYCGQVRSITIEIEGERRIAVIKVLNVGKDDK